MRARLRELSRRKDLPPLRPLRPAWLERTACVSLRSQLVVPMNNAMRSWSDEHSCATAIWTIAEGSLRRCAKCGHWKQQSDFHDSRTGQFSYCKECRNAYDRRYYAERGRAARLERGRARRRQAQSWLNSLKDGLPCTDCGQAFPAPIMHWDHLPGHQKIGAVSDLASSRTAALVLDELKKCELVCANCHSLRTARRAKGRVGEDGLLSGHDRIAEPGTGYFFGTEPAVSAVGVVGFEPTISFLPPGPKPGALPS